MGEMCEHLSCQLCVAQGCFFYVVDKGEICTTENVLDFQKKISNSVFCEEVTTTTPNPTSFSSSSSTTTMVPHPIADGINWTLVAILSVIAIIVFTATLVWFLRRKTTRVFIVRRIIAPFMLCCWRLGLVVIPREEIETFPRVNVNKAVQTYNESTSCSSSLQNISEGNNVEDDGMWNIQLTPPNNNSTNTSCTTIVPPDQELVPTFTPKREMLVDLL